MSKANKVKQSKADFLRSWGFGNNPSIMKAGFSYFRYKNPIEKGIYWYYFSLEIRKRDVEIWGKCISCGRKITLETCDAGHFMPARDCGRDLLFDPVNVNAECKHCNAFDGAHLLGYAEGLDRRYGEGTANTMREIRRAFLSLGKPLKDWKAAEYADMIKKLKSYQEAVSQ
jgi:hypothetical protein